MNKSILLADDPFTINGCHFSKNIKIYLTVSILWLCLFSNAVSSQDLQRIDSLKAALKSQSLVEEYGTLIEITNEYFDKDNKVSLEYIERANKIAHNLKDTSKIVLSGRLKGQLLRRLNRSDEAAVIFNGLLPIANRHKLTMDQTKILNGLAIICTERGRYDQALTFHNQSLVLREAEGDKKAISITLSNIGFVYFKLRDFEKAIEYNTKALQLKRETGDDYDLDRLLINIGLCHLSLNNYKIAEEYITKGLQACGVNCDEQKLAEGKFGLGALNLRLRKYDLALHFFKESLEHSRKIDDKKFVIENLVQLADINIILGNLEQALPILNEAEQLAIAYGYDQLLLETYRQFSTLFSQKRDFEKTSIYQSKFIILNDSLLGSEHLKNLVKTQTNIEERENLALIDLQKTALVKQRYLNVAFAIIALLVVLLIFGLYKRNRFLKKTSEILQEQNREKAGIISVVAHDLKSPLNSIKGLLQLITMTGHMTTEQQQYVNYIKRSIEQGNHLIRDLLDVHSFEHEGSKIELEEIDIKKAIDDWLHTMNGQLSQKNQNLLTQIEINDGQKIFTDRFKLIRILDNLLTNASKFSESGKTINFGVSLTDHMINFSIKDQGPGISEEDKKKLFKRFQKLTARPTAGESSSGLGLSIIHVLVSKLSGSIRVNSKLGEGAEFVVCLPERIHVG